MEFVGVFISILPTLLRSLRLDKAQLEWRCCLVQGPNFGQWEIRVHLFIDSFDDTVNLMHYGRQIFRYLKSVFLRRFFLLFGLYSAYFIGRYILVTNPVHQGL